MKSITTCFLLFIVLNAYSQQTETEKQIRLQNHDTLIGWKKGGLINLGISQTSLSNWAAGGQNSLALNGLLSVYMHKTMKRSMWENYLDVSYGMLKQGPNAMWQKTDDKIDLLTKYGYKYSDKMYVAGLLSFKTQITNGYKFPNISVKISDFLAPAYLLGAIGSEYKPNDAFSLFLAPLTVKATIVKDRELADAGAFGVDPATYDGAGNLISAGDNVRTEFGGYLRMMYKKEVMTNVTFQTRLDLFSNYLNDPKNIDVNWETLISMKVNKFLSATLSTHLIYDDDVKLSIDDNHDGVFESFGPRVQFKETLTAGLSYKF